MRNILLKASFMSNSLSATEYMIKQFEINKDIENDLYVEDLFNYLISIEEPMIIEIDDIMELVDNLGRFGLGILKTLRKVENENENIRLKLL